VDVVAVVGADEESATVVQPGQGAFDDPAVSADAGAVFDLAASGWDRTGELKLPRQAGGDRRREGGYHSRQLSSTTLSTTSAGDTSRPCK
jgi:hypothetical protein